MASTLGRSPPCLNLPAKEDLQSSIGYASGRTLTDLCKVNCVVLGGENAGEHLFMLRPLRS
jgi:hypothetical protein